MEDVTEQSLLGHVQGGQFKEVVHTVFKLHAMLAGLFGRIDERPDFIQCHGGGHFDGHVLAVLHGIDTHFGMVLPVGHNIYDVNIIAVTKLFSGIFGIGVSFCLGQSGFHQCVLCAFHQFGTQVADCLDLYTG